jgi:hypothetical protein
MMSFIGSENISKHFITSDIQDILDIQDIQDIQDVLDILDILQGHPGHHTGLCAAAADDQYFLK